MSRGPKGLGTVYEEPGRGWRAEKRVTLPDGRSRRIVARGKTEREALRNRAAQESALVRAHPDAESITLGQYLDMWLARKTMRDATEREYKRVVMHAKKHAGDVRLSRITPMLVADVLDQIKPPATSNAVRRYLKGAFKQAVARGLLFTNPLESVPPKRTPDTKRRVWQHEEIAKFITASRGSAKALFLVALFAGLRRGELLALRWENVTPTGITVDSTWVRGDKVGPPKTQASYRTVPIHEGLYAQIVEARPEIESEFAFPAGSGRMFGGGNLWRNFRATTKRAGVPVIRFHDMRRTAATLWAEAGVPPKVIQRMLGHSTPHLALAIYTDVMESQMRSAALDPNRVLGGLSGGLKTTTAGTRGDTRDNEAGEEPALDADNTDVHQ